MPRVMALTLLPGATWGRSIASNRSVPAPGVNVGTVTPLSTMGADVMVVTGVDVTVPPPLSTPMLVNATSRTPAVAGVALLV